MNLLPRIDAMNPHDEQMLFMLANVIEHGETRGDRTGDGTISLFGDINSKFDLRLGFPAATAKYLHFHSVKHELKWMLDGSTNIRYLKENKVRIWDEWVKPETAEYRELQRHVREEMLAKKDPAYAKYLETLRQEMIEDGRNYEFVERIIDGHLEKTGIPTKELIAGDLGPVYGSQWRFWPDTRTIPFNDWYSHESAWQEQGYDDVAGSIHGMTINREIDQIARIEQQLKDERDFQNGKLAKHSAGRRIILSGWNVAMVEEMALPPCHAFAQWYVSTSKCEKGLNYLDCKLYMRSNDLGLGKPFNVAQYALLTHMFAHVHGFTPRYYFHSVGDAHIYLKHMDAVQEWLERPTHAAPTLKIKGEYSSILDIPANAITLEGYHHSGKLDMEVSV